MVLRSLKGGESEGAGCSGGGFSGNRSVPTTQVNDRWPKKHFRFFQGGGVTGNFCHTALAYLGNHLVSAEKKNASHLHEEGHRPGEKEFSQADWGELVAGKNEALRLIT